MAAPIRRLSVIQNWSCHVCGNCCSDYWVPVTAAERDRIDKQGWSQLPEFQGVPLFKRYGAWWKFWNKRYRLNHRAGDRCVFLSDKGLCRIHEKFGEAAKPFACQLYPYVLVPVGNHYRVSMRFACPSAVANKGRPLAEQHDELKRYAQLLEEWERGEGHRVPRQGELPPPTLQDRQAVSWAELQQIVEALLVLIRDRRDSMTRRLLKCLAFVRLCREARFDKLGGGRLREFLDLMRRAADGETPDDPAHFASPGWIGRLLFRTFLAIYLRKDQGTRRGVSSHGRLFLILAMGRMAWGGGPLPRLQAGLPDKTFAEMERRDTALGREADELLERYYSIKVESFQFCGVAYYHYSFWEGFEALMLTYPLIRWLARGYAEHGPIASVEKAISVIDENYAYSPFLGSNRQRLALRILSFRGELERLIAWYGR
jgi:lysine-N-methylase